MKLALPDLAAYNRVLGLLQQQGKAYAEELQENVYILSLSLPSSHLMLLLTFLFFSLRRKHFFDGGQGELFAHIHSSLSIFPSLALLID